MARAALSPRTSKILATLDEPQMARFAVDNLVCDRRMSRLLRPKGLAPMLTVAVPFSVKLFNFFICSDSGPMPAYCFALGVDRGGACKYVC